MVINGYRYREFFIFSGVIGIDTGKIWYRKKSQNRYRKKVSEPEEFVTKKSTGIGIENIWYWKKVSVSVSLNILGTVTHWPSQTGYNYLTFLHCVFSATASCSDLKTWALLRSWVAFLEETRVWFRTGCPQSAFAAKTMRPKVCHQLKFTLSYLEVEERPPEQSGMIEKCHDVQSLQRLGRKCISACLTALAMNPLNTQRTHCIQYVGEFYAPPILRPVL